MPKVELELFAKVDKINKRLNDVEKNMKDVSQQTSKTNKSIEKNFKKSGAAVSKFTGLIAGALTVGAAVQFTKAIINVRKEFEKYAAVLTNTLGSQEAAAEAMEQLKTFAAETPFSLQQ